MFIKRAVIYNNNHKPITTYRFSKNNWSLKYEPNLTDFKVEYNYVY